MIQLSLALVHEKQLVRYRQYVDFDRSAFDDANTCEVVSLNYATKGLLLVAEQHDNSLIE